MKTNLIAQDGFIQDLFVNYNANEDKADLYEFLNYNFSGYNLICDFKDYDEFNIALEENPLWELMLDKFDEVYFSDNLQENIYSDDFYKDLGEYNIFLTTESNEKCDNLESDRGYLYLNTNNIGEKWNIIRNIRKGMPLKVTKDPIIPENQRIDSWSKLESIFIPCTGIVIFDKYLLKDSSNQKIEDNLYPLLEVILSKCTSIEPITISIIVEDTKKCIIHFREKLLAHLSSKGISNIDINIVKHHKRFYPNSFEGLHSRYILTNYLRIKSEDSFNYFKPNGKINNDSDIRVDFCLDNRFHPLFKKDMNDLKRYLKSIKNDTTNVEEWFRTMFHPNKQNRILN